MTTFHEKNTLSAACSLHQAQQKTQHSFKSEVSQVEYEQNPKETIKVYREGQESQQGQQAFTQMKSKFDAHEKPLKKLLKCKESKKKSKKYYDSDPDSDSF